MKTFKLIIESTNDGIWGRWEHKGNTIVARGNTLDDLKENFVEAVNLYFEETNRPQIVRKDIRYEFHVDLENLFEVNDYIKISKLAEYVGINKSLLRQYAKGIKYPSLRQALKIEKALKNIGSNLLSTKLLADQH
jgi:transcriptional regulator with XRE-family HTH domain